MPRDRNATARRIIDAAARLIEREGVPALGVNAVAAEAGVDKVLVYRYFGGLDGLLQAVGREHAAWPDHAAHAADASSLSAALAAALIQGGRSLRERPLPRAALAWELHRTNDLTRALGASRASELSRLLEVIRAEYDVPARADLEAIIAVLAAGVAHLALHAEGEGEWAGLDLASSSDWQRVEKSVRMLLAALLEHRDD